MIENRRYSVAFEKEKHFFLVFLLALLRLKNVSVKVCEGFVCVKSVVLINLPCLRLPLLCPRPPEPAARVPRAETNNKQAVSLVFLE